MAESSEVEAVPQPNPAAEGSELFTCPICLDHCPRSEVFVPSGCAHEFCRDCARGVVLSAVRYVPVPVLDTCCCLMPKGLAPWEQVPTFLFMYVPFDVYCANLLRSVNPRVPFAAMSGKQKAKSPCLISVGGCYKWHGECQLGWRQHRAKLACYLVLRAARCAD